MNTAIRKRVRKTKDANVRDHLRLVGDMQDGLTVTAAANLGMSSTGAPSWARYQSEGFDGLEDRLWLNIVSRVFVINGRVFILIK